MIDSTTTDSTFGQVTTPVETEASAMPSTGTFVKGAYIRSNAAPSYSGVTGWLRETTGSGNTLDSGSGGDWIALH